MERKKIGIMANKVKKNKGFSRTEVPKPKASVTEGNEKLKEVLKDKYDEQPQAEQPQAEQPKAEQPKAEQPKEKSKKTSIGSKIIENMNPKTSGVKKSLGVKGDTWIIINALANQYGMTVDVFLKELAEKELNKLGKKDDLDYIESAIKISERKVLK